MATLKTQASVIETETVERNYGMTGTNAIVYHPRYGRILLKDGFGGQGQLRGGAVRWEHGAIYRIRPTDTLESLRADRYNDEYSVMEALMRGYGDSDRYWLDGVTPQEINRLALSLGL